MRPDPRFQLLTGPDVFLTWLKVDKDFVNNRLQALRDIKSPWMPGLHPKCHLLCLTDCFVFAFLFSSGAPHWRRARRSCRCLCCW
jgi:hypothetical protein